MEPCYESHLFRDWCFGAGRWHTGPRAGQPIRLSDVQAGRFAVLTTRFPGEEEQDRRVVGLFRIGEIIEERETIVVASPEGRVRLPMEEARQLFFWAYHNTSSERPDWRTGLTRYLDEGQVHRTLVDIAATLRDEHIKAEVDELIAEVFGDASGPPALGPLAVRSSTRSDLMARSRKYGRGGEGKEHKKLKEWLSHHPREIGLADISSVRVEYTFPSGDTADLVFQHQAGGFTVVEVETTDPLPGAYQAIKYRALLSAENGLDLDTPKVRAILVAWHVAADLREFCDRYTIGWREIKLE